MDPFGVSPAPDAMKLGFQCVRTHWNRGFMPFPAGRGSAGPWPRPGRHGAPSAL